MKTSFLMLIVLNSVCFLVIDVSGIQTISFNFKDSNSIKYDSIVDFNFTTIEDPFSLVDYINESFLIQPNDYVTLNFTNNEQSYFWFNQTVNKSIQTFVVNESQFVCFKNKEPFSDVFGSSFNFGILDNPWCYPKGNFTGYTNINQIGNLIIIFNNGYDSQASVLFSIARLVIEPKTATTISIMTIDLGSFLIYDENFSLESGDSIIYKMEITSTSFKLFINLSVDQYDEGKKYRSMEEVAFSILNQSAYDNWLKALNSSDPKILSGGFSQLGYSHSFDSEGKYYVILTNNKDRRVTGHILLKKESSIEQKIDFIFFPMIGIGLSLIVLIKRKKKQEIEENNT